MTAFLTSIVVSVLMAGAIIWEGKHRPPGTKVTWGEAMFAAMFIFFLMLMVYGVVPDRWLRYADGELKWRTDKIGIPMGPMGHFLHNVLHIGSATNVIAPNGVKFFGRGKIKISANTIENIISTLIYGVAIWPGTSPWSAGGRTGARSRRRRPSRRRRRTGAPWSDRHDKQIRSERRAVSDGPH